MSVSFSLKEGKIEQTIAIPAKEEKKELGEKEAVIAELEAKIVSFQATIDAVTAQKAEVQSKLDIINAL